MPVLQNAFSNPGWTIAANIGTADAGDAYGVAGAWAPRSGTVQVSAGAGWLARVGGADGVTWGLRIMAPVPVLGPRDGGLGLAAFAGVGGASPSDTLELRAPVGATIGYRRAIANGRTISLYGSPLVAWSRTTGGAASGETSTVFRYTIGLDVAVTNRIGVTLGYEGGSDPRPDRPGPRGTIYGVGVSYAIAPLP